jgi:hypothetical protein
VVELACQCSNTSHAGQHFWDPLQTIIANDWGGLATCPLKERKEQQTKLAEFRLK